MNKAAYKWQEVHEDANATWVCDLDDRLHGTDHRRLMVWVDEFTGKWCWEIETFSGLGFESRGSMGTREGAMSEAEAAALQICIRRQQKERP